MKKTKDRIIIDTNLWISFLLTNNFTKLDAVFTAHNSTLLFSEELLSEFLEVASRPKFQKYFSSTDLQNALEQINIYAEFINVNSEISLCRDPKDNFLLSLALDGKATHLITGDKDLLEINRFENTEIITISSYLSTI
ncbi:MAG: putative toxin-antitoxin system toxin component, PIN family [Sphingobacteriaceae bacterium]|nr:MAG: putative toxin-antitoxin system toxin component, PIN family [Sphingobacteriaceae bacterium]